MITNHLRTATFTTCTGDSDGNPVKGTEREHILLFNEKSISMDEIKKEIDDGSWEYDPRFIEVSRKQLAYLKGSVVIS